MYVKRRSWIWQIQPNHLWLSLIVLSIKFWPRKTAKNTQNNILGSRDTTCSTSLASDLTPRRPSLCSEKSNFRRTAGVHRLETSANCANELVWISSSPPPPLSATSGRLTFQRRRVKWDTLGMALTAMGPGRGLVCPAHPSPVIKLFDTDRPALIHHRSFKIQVWLRRDRSEGLLPLEADLLFWWPLLKGLHLGGAVLGASFGVIKQATHLLVSNWENNARNLQSAEL